MITSADVQKQAYENFNDQAEFYANDYRPSDLFTFGSTWRDRQGDLANTRAANAFNAWQAQLQRDFEEHLSNTEVQRRVKDFAAAGFSPLALLGNASAASSPSGVSASYSSGSKMRSKEKSGLMDLASLAIRVLGLIAVAG